MTGSNSITSITYKYETVTLQFFGALQSTAQNDAFETIDVNILFERIGNTVNFTIPNIYISEQSAGYITTVNIPADFRPSDDRYINNMMIINGSQAGWLFLGFATAENGTSLGNGLVQANGNFFVGCGRNNAGNLILFGGEGTSGSGNGLLSGTYSYQI